MTRKMISWFMIALVSSLVIGASIPTWVVAEPKYCEDGYNGSSYQGTVTETVNYTYRDDAEYNIPTGLPKYTDGTGLENICAVLAGATIMGFYDRIHDNLIPDFTAARIIRGQTIYTNNSQKIQQLITTLYGLMGSSSTGTTLDGFMAGMRSYVASKGSNIVFSDAGSDFSAIKSYVEGENLVALFMDTKFNFIPYGSITSANNQDIIIKELYSGYHVSTIYGFRIINYYNGSSLITTKRFFKVSTGHASAPLAYIEFDDSVVVGAALRIAIS